MHGLVTLVLEHLRAIGAPAYPSFEQMLVHSMAQAPPPFGEHWYGRRYFELARHADWFANSLVANATMEGYGSKQIWAFSNRIDNDAHAASVRRHALDESRHSTMFIRMLKMVFPCAIINEDTERALDLLQPRFSVHNHPSTAKATEPDRHTTTGFLYEMVGIQLTEIRALVLQLLLRATLLAYSPAEHRTTLAHFSDVLIRDESRHIAYAASIIEAEAASGYQDFLIDAFTQRLREFNDLTMVELERDKVRL